MEPNEQEEPFALSPMAKDLLGEIESIWDRKGQDVTFPTNDNENFPSHEAPGSSSRALDSSDALDMFEDPLIDVSPLPWMPATTRAGLGMTTADSEPTEPHPRIRDGAARETAEEFSLLDIDDTNVVPPTLQPQVAAALASGLPIGTLTSFANASLEFSGPSASHLPEESSEVRVQLQAWVEERSTEINGVGVDGSCCANASKRKLPCYFCWPCHETFCDDCWGRQRAHNRNSQRQCYLPHEKTDPSVAQKIQGTLESELTDEEQARLHFHDEDTSWFAAERTAQDDMYFQDYGRYANIIAENSAKQRKLRYPALVSFIGQTGAGKSTLVRLLIELCESGPKRLQVPVVGSVNHQDTPTSGDVHLYSDPESSLGEHPILYADCEGLDGGEREPKGARSRHRSRDVSGPEHPHETATSRSKARTRNLNTSEREILWATSEQKRSRDYIVRNLYPRLLYTFSDVVVFVMKNPRVIETVIEQLIVWAAAALETSSNQPVLPHAIIVLNASDNATDPELWDVDKSTIALMRSVGQAVFKNPTLKSHAVFWRERKRFISSVEALLMSYYSSVRVVRVPERGRPKLIYDQLQRLREEIATACGQSRASKHRVRMLLNSDELQPYLQYAFDHFCKDLDFPFDFVQASFANNSIPSDFGGNILKLAINIMDVWRNRLTGSRIFKELSFMVASCIMLDAARYRTLGPADKVFPEYIAHCDDALDDFCDRHWPCEFMSPRGRCVNVKVGHNTKGHQLRSGQVLDAGSYQSSFSAEACRDSFLGDTYTTLAKLLEKLQEATAESTHLELAEAENLHQDFVLKYFYNHLGNPRDFVSHTACFSCLVGPPEHPLPCGHVLCTLCVRAFGAPRGKTTIEMKYCPLHGTNAEAHFESSCSISLKPSGAGVRVLTLDGGGVRGMVELVILQQIQQALGVEIPIQAFFDLIVGTDTGGLIALGLGTRGWPVQKCLKQFEVLCEGAFTKRRRLSLLGIDFLVSASNHSRYGTKPLETALQNIYSGDSLFGGARRGSNSMTEAGLSTKVAVTTTTTNGTVMLLANYNRVNRNDGDTYQFYRSEKPQAEIKIWEAARATMAAPRIFKPFNHEPSGQIFQDGAIYYNNPVELGIREKELIWPDVPEVNADIVLSIGAGHNTETSYHVAPSSRGAQWGKVSRAKHLAKMAIDNIQSTVNSEQAWYNFIAESDIPERLMDRYIRFNVDLRKVPPKLDEVSAMGELQEVTRGICIRRREEIKMIADRLIASSFYFEIRPRSVMEGEDGSISLTGAILCRFSPASEEVRALGEAFRRRSKDAYNQRFANHDPYFLIAEHGRECEAVRSLITTHHIQQMMRHGHFSLGQLKLTLSDREAETEISLCFAETSSGTNWYPISGFPRCLVEEDSRILSKTRLTRSLGRRRTPTTAHRRSNWILPLSVDKTFDPIDRYVAADYMFPGDATPEALSDTLTQFSPQSGASSVTSQYQDTGFLTYQSPESVITGQHSVIWHELDGRPTIPRISELPTSFNDEPRVGSEFPRIDIAYGPHKYPPDPSQHPPSLYGWY